MRNWRTEMPGRVLSRANCCQSRGPGWVIAPSVGQLGHRAVRVTWAMADTVIIINAATQCRTFSHLQLRSKSPGHWDKKSQFWPQQNKWHMGQRSDETTSRTFTDSFKCVITSSTHYMFSYTADKLLLDFNVSAWSQLNIWPPSQRTESLNRIHFNA